MPKRKTKQSTKAKTQPVAAAASASTTTDSAPVQSAPETTTADSEQNALPCLNLRRDGVTCLEEMEFAKDKPNLFSEAQARDILAKRNLCANCRKKV